MHAGTYRRAATATAVVALGLVGLGGCGSDGGGSAGAHDGSAGTSADGGVATSAANAPAPPPSPPVATHRPTATPTPPPTKTAPPAAGGTSNSNSTSTSTSTKACFDGTCDITLSKPTTIPVDSRFGFSAFKITHIGTDGVTVEANGGGTHLESGVSPGGTAALNGLSIKVKSVTGHTARLSISPST